jgi:hypothetical protein
MESIKASIISRGENSRLKGVQRNAKHGTGNYSFKNAKAVDSCEAMKMTCIKFMDDKKGNTLAHGIINNEHVYYANETANETIQALKQKAKGRVYKRGNTEITPSSTYDRWKKRHDANFAAWFGKRI